MEGLLIGSPNPLLLPIHLITFGIKRVWSGQIEMPKADHYIDCRSVANPCYKLHGTGDDSSVQAWVKAHTEAGADEMYAFVEEAIQRLPIRRGPQWNMKPFVIGCFCAHGIHRSRSIAYLMKAKMEEMGYQDVSITQKL